MVKRESALKGNEKSELYMLLPIILITTVFMFIARVKVLPALSQDMYWYTGQGYDIDIYVYWKKMFFIACTVVGLIMLLVSAAMGKAKIVKHRVYIPMAVFSLFVALSYFFSAYKEAALAGASTRLEGTWVLICYMLILFFAMNAVRSEKGVKVICMAFAAACTLLSIWGVLEGVFGIKITSLPEWLYYPTSVRDSIEVSKSGDSGYVEWFFTNRNYTSFFMVMPISIFSMISISSEDKKEKVFFAALVGLIFFSLWGASSMGGIVGTACAAVMGAIVFGFGNIKKWSKSIAVIIAFVLLATAAAFPIVKDEFKSTLAMEDSSGSPSDVTEIEAPYITEETENSIEAENILAEAVITDAVEDSEIPFNATQEVIQPEYFDIDYIKTIDNSVMFSFEGTPFTIVCGGADDIKVLDGNGSETEDYSKYFLVSAYDGTVKSTGENTVYIDVSTANFKWEFTLFNDVMYYLAASGQGVTLDGQVDTFGFKGHETLATNRGYIWSRSLPLIKDTVFVGHGADTFVYYFPQDDYAGRYNVGMYANGTRIMVDKPHNMYIATAINTGVISLIALLAVYAMYIIESVKIYRKREFSSYKEYVGAGIMLAITGILVGGIVNDSVINVMAVSFTFMGVGFAINRMIKNGN